MNEFVCCIEIEQNGSLSSWRADRLCFCRLTHRISAYGHLNIEACSGCRSLYQDNYSRRGRNQIEGKEQSLFSLSAVKVPEVFELNCLDCWLAYTHIRNIKYTLQQNCTISLTLICPKLLIYNTKRPDLHGAQALGITFLILGNTNKLTSRSWCSYHHLLLHFFTSVFIVTEEGKVTCKAQQGSLVLLFFMSTT